MKIGPIDTKPPAAVPAERKSEPAPIKNAAVPSTEVALSSAATAASSGASEATFDAAKVERIATAIRDGKFKINPEVIADKLISNAEELLGRKLN